MSIINGDRMDTLSSSENDHRQLHNGTSPKNAGQPPFFQIFDDSSSSEDDSSDFSDGQGPRGINANGDAHSEERHNGPKKTFNVARKSTGKPPRFPIRNVLETERVDHPDPDIDIEYGIQVSEEDLEDNHINAEDPFEDFQPQKRKPGRPRKHPDLTAKYIKKTGTNGVVEVVVPVQKKRGRPSKSLLEARELERQWDLELRARQNQNKTTSEEDVPPPPKIPKISRPYLQTDGEDEAKNDADYRPNSSTKPKGKGSRGPYRKKVKSSPTGAPAAAAASTVLETRAWDFEDFEQSDPLATLANVLNVTPPPKLPKLKNSPFPPTDEEDDEDSDKNDEDFKPSSLKKPRGPRGPYRRTYSIKNRRGPRGPYRKKGKIPPHQLLSNSVLEARALERQGNSPAQDGNVTPPPTKPAGNVKSSPFHPTDEEKDEDSEDVDYRPNCSTKKPKGLRGPYQKKRGPGRPPKYPNSLRRRGRPPKSSSPKKIQFHMENTAGVLTVSVKENPKNSTTDTAVIKKRGPGRPRGGSKFRNIQSVPVVNQVKIPVPESLNQERQLLNTGVFTKSFVKLDVRPGPLSVKQSRITSMDPSSASSNKNKITLEVCVDNFQSVLNAEKGGAKRVEMCSALSEGGLTPTVGLLKLSKEYANIPIFVMIRPRGGDFIYSDEEIEIMRLDILSLKGIGADGFVFGGLDPQGNVDKRMETLLEAAEPLPCTFHRAFDQASDPLGALNEIIRMGFKRILTSGQEPTAYLGIPNIIKLVKEATGRIQIMPGCGVNPLNVGDIVKTGVTEVHGSASVKIKSKMLKTNTVSMSSKPAGDDSEYSACDAGIVSQIVKNANQAYQTSCP